MMQQHDVKLLGDMAHNTAWVDKRGSVQLTTMLGKASLFQAVAKLLDGVHKVVGVLALLEGRGIHKVAIEGPHLAGQGLHQHPNRHSGWEGMWVDDQIRPAVSCTICQSEHSAGVQTTGRRVSMCWTGNK